MVGQIVANTVPQTPSSVTALKKCLPSHIHQAGSPEYESFIQSGYFYVQARLKPSCIVCATCVDDVASAVKALADAGEDAKFAVRGGGHSTNCGFSGIENGVTFDMRKLNKVAIDEGTGLVQVGAGAKWDDVYRVTDAQGLHVMGGRESDVGVAGYLLGGGLSYFAPSRGWGCDSIENMEVVLASGEVVHANPKENADLFRALRGGANNFGVVTRFDLRPQAGISKFYGGAVQWLSNPEVDTVTLDAFSRIRDKNSPSYYPDLAVEHNYVYYGAYGAYLTSSNIFVASDKEEPERIKMFTDVPGQTLNTMRHSNTLDFADEIMKFQPTDMHSVFMATSFANKNGILAEVQRMWKEVVKEQIEGIIPNGVAVITFQYMPASNKVGGVPNALGVPDDHEEPQILALVNNYWTDGKYAEQGRKAASDLLSRIEAAAQEKDAVNGFKYLAYSDYSQDVFASYGEEQVKFLKTTANKYDPTGVFQKQCIGGFKL